MQPASVATGVGGPGRAARAVALLDALKRAILLGELPPGAALLELELAQRYGCSQGTVREALLGLQDDGLVVRQAHKGTRVSDCTEAEAVEMFRLRHDIETRGVRRACGHMTPALLDDLGALVRAMEHAAAEGDEYGLAEHDRAFHRRLFQAAGLPAVEPLLYRCILHNHRFKITRSAGPRDLPTTARRHWTIVDALRAGDSAAAERAVGHHVATIVDLGPELFAAGAEPVKG